MLFIVQYAIAITELYELQFEGARQCLYNGQLVRCAFGDRLGMVEGQLACMLCPNLVAPRNQHSSRGVWTLCLGSCSMDDLSQPSFAAAQRLMPVLSWSIRQFWLPCIHLWTILSANWLMKILGAVQYSPVSLMIGTVRIFLVTFLQ